MGRLHYFKQDRLEPRIRPWARIIWLNGAEWRGILLVVGLHEIGLRIGKETK